jgi:hypothetical protein
VQRATASLHWAERSEMSCPGRSTVSGHWRHLARAKSCLCFGTSTWAGSGPGLGSTCGEDTRAGHRTVRELCVSHLGQKESRDPGPCTHRASSRLTPGVLALPPAWGLRQLGGPYQNTPGLLRAGSPESRCWPGWVLVRAILRVPLLVLMWPFLCAQRDPSSS